MMMIKSNMRRHIVCLAAGILPCSIAESDVAVTITRWGGPQVIVAVVVLKSKKGGKTKSKYHGLEDE